MKFYYQKELNLIRKKEIFRKREIFNEIIDLASNDYLGLSKNLELPKLTFEALNQFGTFSPKASMLVNGYSEVHKQLENLLTEIHGFEDAIILGSGFLANFSMIESLVRKGDELFIDSEYHASGMVATKLLNRVSIFKHNSIDDLEKKLKISKANRKIIAVEGIYSMSGDIVPKEIFTLADKFNAILIVDEAHSFGVVGKKLLGVFDYYNIPVKNNYIKMGTFGKAIGSYGAYILASQEIISFLENRGKPIIYSTALSLFDTMLAYFSIKYIYENSSFFYDEVKKRKDIGKNILNFKTESLIFIQQVNSSQKVMEIKEILKNDGIIVGAIRPPTVPKAILRIIPNLSVSVNNLIQVLERIKIMV